MVGAMPEHLGAALLWVMMTAHLCQVLHVRRLDVHYIETLVSVIKMPQVHPQVVAGDEGLLITTNGNGIDVISMRIAIDLPTPCLHHLLYSGDLHQ